jgi:hypothetical protein
LLLASLDLTPTEATSAAGNQAHEATAHPAPADHTASGRLGLRRLGTRVNLKPGHVEPARLFEAQDPVSGRVYSVMVPDVCGNVSDTDQAPGGQARRRS